MDDPRFRLESTTPSTVARKLLAGTVDLGLVSSIELVRQPLQRVSTSCIASDGPVTSVLVALRVAPHRVTRLGVDPASRTSQLLAELVLRHLGAAPDVVECAPDQAFALGCDAALVIGDPAFAWRAAGRPVLDLGEEWTKMTGLPFVYGVWAVHQRSTMDALELGRWLDDSREDGCKRVDGFARDAESAGVLDAAEARVYLTRRIRYRFGSREEAGLHAYLDAVRSLPRGTLKA